MHRDPTTIIERDEERCRAARASRRRRPIRLRGAALLGALLLAPQALAGTVKDAPSRPPGKGCTWEKMSDAKLGLALWAQRCDYGFRKIDFLFTGTSLAQRYSDGGAPEAVIDVFDLEPGEKPDAGVKRIFTARTAADVARRCVLAPYRVGKTPAGAERFTFVPDRAYAKELKKKADPNEVPDPPCGDLGDAPDGIQYFETQPGSGARKFLFVRVGQDEPLFDERTLRLLPPP
jgi:hypothetical protein